MKTILCVDIGTTSLKMSLISDTGNVVAFSTQNLNVFKTDYLANQWFQSFIKGTSELLKSAQNISSTDICAISISGNGPTIVSQNGRTLLWNNSLSKELKDSIPQTNSLFMPQLVTFKKNYQDEWNDSRFIFSGPEFLIWKLTGSAVTVLPEKRFEPAYWNDSLLELCGIEKNKIPPFVPVAYNAGTLIPEIAATISLSAKTPVFCGGPDFIAALIGTNTLQSGKICDRAGSSEGINFCSNKQIFAEGLRTLPSVIPGLWNISAIIPESGSLINEFKNEISALEGNEISYSEIIDYAFNDKNSEGWRILSKLKSDVKEGLSKIHKLCAKNNIEISDTMTITGGQAKNSRWLQEKSNAADIKIAVCNSPDSELTGNAVIALYGLGKYKSISEAADKIVRTVQIYAPEKELKKNLKIYSIPKKLRTIIFDIDSTLYTSSAYAFEQVDTQIRHWAKKQGISEAQARNKISEFRKNWSKQNGGKKISLGNAFTHFGVSIEESIEMRRTLLEPKNFLKRDEKLIKTIKTLKQNYKLICVTNNPVLPARKTLEAIGIASLIPDIIGLDTCGKSKPALEPFQLACKITGSKPEECLAIGDRYDMDIALPIQMGMGGILVTSVQDVYKLTELI